MQIALEILSNAELINKYCSNGMTINIIPSKSTVTIRIECVNSYDDNGDNVIIASYDLDDYCYIDELLEDMKKNKNKLDRDFELRHDAWMKED